MKILFKTLTIVGTFSCSAINISSVSMYKFNINKLVYYSWKDKYYSWTKDSSNTYGILDYTYYADTWNEFVEKYPTYQIFGSLYAGYENPSIFAPVEKDGRTKSFSTYNTSDLVKTNKISHNFEAFWSYLVGPGTIESKTWIDFYIYKKDEIVYFYWNAFFKGPVKNTIEIIVDNILFYAA